MSSDDQRAVDLILIGLRFLFFLIDLAAQLNQSFHSSAEISTVGFTANTIVAALGVIIVLFSLKKKQG